MIRIALDQIAYMRALLVPAALSNRLRAYAAYRAAGGASVGPAIPAGSDASLPPPWRAESGDLLARLVSVGEIPRAAALASLPGAERTRRGALRTLLVEGVLETDHHRAPVRLAFPEHASSAYAAMRRSWQTKTPARHWRAWERDASSLSGPLPYPPLTRECR